MKWKIRYSLRKNINNKMKGKMKKKCQNEMKDKMYLIKKCQEWNGGCNITKEKVSTKLEIQRHFV